MNDTKKKHRRFRLLLGVPMLVLGLVGAYFAMCPLAPNAAHLLYGNDATLLHEAKKNSGWFIVPLVFSFFVFFSKDKDVFVDSGASNDFWR